MLDNDGGIIDSNDAWVFPIFENCSQHQMRYFFRKGKCMICKLLFCERFFVESFLFPHSFNSDIQ